MTQLSEEVVEVIEPSEPEGVFFDVYRATSFDGDRITRHEFAIFCTMCESDKTEVACNVSDVETRVLIHMKEEHSDTPKALILWR